MLQHTYDLIVYLESPKSQLSKTFFWIENPLNIKEVMSQNVCVYVLFKSSTSLTYIALQPLGVFDLSLTSWT